MCQTRGLREDEPQPQLRRISDKSDDNPKSSAEGCSRGRAKGAWPMTRSVREIKCSYYLKEVREVSPVLPSAMDAKKARRLTRGFPTEIRESLEKFLEGNLEL